MRTPTQLPDGLIRSIEEEALSWVGVPFLHLGRGRKGIDCAGVVIMTARALGLSDYENRSYSFRASGSDLLVPFNEHMDHIHLRDLGAGDVLVTRDDNERLPCHCGIVVRRPHDELGFVHAWIRRGKVVESRLDDWLPRGVRGYRFRVT